MEFGESKNELKVFEAKKRKTKKKGEKMKG